jgi:hypothetical protein
MKYRSVSRRTLPAGVFLALAALFGVAAVAISPCARADTVAYLVNVHVRPGYNFPDADAALSYGYGICDKVAAGRGFPRGHGRREGRLQYLRRLPGLVSDLTGGQRTLPGADLAVAELSSALPVAARRHPLTVRRQTWRIGRWDCLPW